MKKVDDVSLQEKKQVLQKSVWARQNREDNVQPVKIETENLETSKPLELETSRFLETDNSLALESPIKRQIEGALQMRNFRAKFEDFEDADSVSFGIDIPKEVDRAIEQLSHIHTSILNNKEYKKKKDIVLRALIEYLNKEFKRLESY